MIVLFWVVASIVVVLSVVIRRAKEREAAALEVWDLVAPLLERLELDVEPKMIRSVTVAPRSVTVERYAANELGAKFIGASGGVALERLEIPVRMTIGEPV